MYCGMRVHNRAGDCLSLALLLSQTDGALGVDLHEETGRSWTRS